MKQKVRLGQKFFLRGCSRTMKEVQTLYLILASESDDNRSRWTAIRVFRRVGISALYDGHITTGCDRVHIEQAAKPDIIVQLLLYQMTPCCRLAAGKAY